ncbi:uncharacterized protein LOC129004926 [Macrosteles quadrilineatus]|uniref:uncharacterized protein LOC129004926 n=1 Tax=Macrosteles quadrilineatus TaxID=74068 RepID=UPI0023E1D88A|nr:uncharacterized protein LOC129004926 [Macrosteles quadrilineatus]
MSFSFSNDTANILFENKGEGLPDVKEEVDSLQMNSKNAASGKNKLSEVNELKEIEDELSEELKEMEEEMELLELSASNFQDEATFIESNDKKTNRRYSLRPQRKLQSTHCDKFSSNAKKRATPTLPKNGTLETIFENPVFTRKNGSLSLMGKTRLKRYLSFDDFVNKTKQRHRKLKVKRLRRGKKQSKCLKVSVEDVKLKLQSLDEEVAWMSDDGTK